MSYLGKADPVHLTSTQIRVLHVDDQRDIADVTAEFLERESDDITVVTETTVQNGLDRLANESIDCIVSDYEMPGQNGIEFLERVREEHGDVPFILYTGKGSEEIASEAISAGVTDYLQKEPGTDQYTVLANRIENAVEHHWSRRAVKATEKKLLQLAERTDDILFMFDGEWEDLLFVNSAYEDMWGGSIADLRDDPTTFLDHIHPEDRDRAKTSLERLQQGKPDTIEYRITTDEGDHRWVRGETKPIFDEDGNVSRITGFVRDITDRKTREQELEARATAMEAATDGIAILNDEQGYVFMNDAHAAMYGFDDPDELLGKSWRVCYDDEDVSQFETDILPQLSKTGEWHGEMTVTAADGQRIHQELQLKRLDDGRVVCVVRDITDRKEREQELRRYKILAEEVTDSIGVVSEDGTIQYENPAIERILGYDRRELEGTSAFEYMHPDDRQDVIDRFSALVTGDSRDPERVRYRMRHADGSWRWLESEASARTDPALEGYVITSRDITEHKTHEQTVRDLHGIARELVQADTPEEVSEITVEAFRDVLEMPANTVHLYEEDENGLVPVAWTAAGEELVGEPPTFHPGEGFAWEAFETGEPQVYDDVSTAPGRLNPETEIRSEMILPLGEHGVLLIGSNEAKTFDETDFSLARTLAAHATTVLHRIARESDLRETTERYRTLIEHFPDGGVFLYDDDLRCVLAGGEGLSTAGFSIDDITGTRLRDRYPEEIATELERNIRHAFDGESSVFEQTYQGRSYRVQTLPIGDAPVDQVMAVSQDITTRKKREDALEALQERTHSLMHTATKPETAQIAVDAAEEILDAQLSGVHLQSDTPDTLEPVAFLDTVRDELGEPPVYDRTAESDPPSEIVWDVFESGDPLVISDTRDHAGLAEATPARSAVIQPLGEYGVFMVSATEPDAFDSTEETLVEILATALTAALDRVDRETQLREREQRVQTERERLSALFEMVPDPILHVQFEEGEPILVDANSALTEMFGADAAAVSGQSVNDLIVQPEDQEEAETIDERVRTEGTISQEVRRQTLEGTRDFLFRSVPITDPDETDEYYGIYIDITDQKTTERRLEEQNERLDEFASLVSHDLRNPLTVAEGQLVLAQEECESEHLETIHRAHERMETLIDDILTLAREGEQATNIEAVSLSKTVEGCWQNVATEDATLDIASEQTIQADPNRLQRLLENLFRNAIEHGGEGVNVRVGELDGGFYVADDGPGIPDDDRGRLFETGFSTAEEGTGFGLAIVKEIVDAHGWEVRVTDGSDGGARFEFTALRSAESDSL
jgi:PAS domain S-box-containing protein